MLPVIIKNRIINFLEQGYLFEDIAVECETTVSEVLTVYKDFYGKNPPVLTLNGYTRDVIEPNKVINHNEEIGICPNCHQTVTLPCYACYIRGTTTPGLSALMSENTQNYLPSDKIRLNNIKKLRKIIDESD